MDGRLLAVGLAGVVGSLATLSLLRRRVQYDGAESGEAPVLQQPIEDARTSRAVRLLEITRDIGLQGDLLGAITKLLQHTSQLVGADRCTLFLADRTVAPGFLFAGNMPLSRISCCCPFCVHTFAGVFVLLRQGSRAQNPPVLSVRSAFRSRGTPSSVLVLSPVESSACPSA
jgi:hypothetical protein